MTSRNNILFYPACIAISLLLLLTSSEAQIIKVSYNSDAINTFSGKVYLFLSKEYKEPKEGSAGLEFLPCYSITVNNIKPGEVVVFDDAATSFPVAISDLEIGQYYVQAVWDRNLGGRAIGYSPGNIYNNSAKFTFTKNNLEIFNLNCEVTIEEPTFKETQAAKEMKVPSRLLSFFISGRLLLTLPSFYPKNIMMIR